MDTKVFAQDIETDFSFTCPPTFLEFHTDFLAFADTSAFTRKFGDAHVVTSAAEVAHLHAHSCPKWIIPFLWVQNPTARDYYGFDNSHCARPHGRMNLSVQNAIVMRSYTIHGWVPNWIAIGFVSWSQNVCAMSHNMVFTLGLRHTFACLATGFWYW